MLSTRLVSRANLSQYASTVQRLHTSTLLLDSSDSSSSDSDQKELKKKAKSKPDKNEEKKLKSRQETNERINRLLTSMIEKSTVSKSIDLSMRPKKRNPQPEPKEQPFEDKLIGAAKSVAASLGGDVKKTESDLLTKLMSRETNKLNDQQTENSSEQATSFNLNDLLVGMKFNRTRQDVLQNVEMSRSAQVQSLYKKFNRTPYSQQGRGEYKKRDFSEVETGNLYGGDPLRIFDSAQTGPESQDTPRLETWKNMQEREFNLSITHPPNNIFEEMILWTKEGKLWKFPIDNEQGMEEEQNVHFSEHVFMDRHLQDWCPKRGPIRHFMELVCVGLSKNPYMTVNEKKEHILWYREYFGSKQELLKEIGAINENISQSKKIEA